MVAGSDAAASQELCLLLQKRLSVPGTIEGSGGFVSVDFLQPYGDDAHFSFLIFHIVTQLSAAERRRKHRVFAAEALAAGVSSHGEPECIKTA